MKDELISVFKGKCPKCNSSSFYEDSFFKGTPQKDSSTYGLQYKRESRFFQYSDYLTYSLGLATIIILGLVSYLLFPNYDLMLYIWIALAAIIILTPFTYPFSKIIWANMFLHGN